MAGRDGELRCCRTCRAVYRSGFHRCPIDGTELSSFEADPVIGTTVSDLYEVEACVGEGAMGRVYRAHHLRLQGRRVALKILLGDFAASVAMRMRFTQEAQAASLLSHPNVVSVLDFGKDEQGLLYLAMEYVEGRSLASIIAQEGPLPPERVIHLARQLCQGLDHAHGRGLVHRDFKPDNVLVVDGPDGEVARIADFGLAIFPESEDGARLTTAGTVVGTPLYIAPEQALDRPVDGRADLFSLGVSMYEMLAGVPPFDDSASAMAILQDNLSARRPPIRERAPSVVVDPALEQIVHRLLRPDREHRPASAAAVIEALDSLGGQPTRARTAGGQEGWAEVIEIVETNTADFVLPRHAGRRIAVGLVLLGGIAAAAAAMFWPLGGLGPRLQAVVAGGPSPPETTAIDADAPGPEPAATGSAPVAGAGSAEAIAPARSAAVVPTLSAAGSMDAPADGASARSASTATSPRLAGSRRGRTISPAVGAAEQRGEGEDEAARGSSGADPLLAAASAAEAARENAAAEPGIAASAEPRAGEPAPAASLSADPPGGASSAASTGGPSAESPGPSATRAAPAPVAASPQRPPPPRPRPSLVARTAIQSLEVDGSLSTAEVRRGIARVEQRLSACYSAAAIRAGRDGAGDVTLRFVIGENGRADQVSAGGAPLPGLGACVADAIGDVRTRVAPDVGEVRVSLRVHFAPRGAGGDQR